MKIPKSVKVGSMEYEVIKETDLYIDTVDGAKLPCYGLCEYGKHKIYLDPDIQDDQGMEQTFFHELAHALLKEQGIILCKMGVSAENEEDIVDAIGRGLHQIVKDNPKIFTTK